MNRAADDWLRTRIDGIASTVDELVDSIVGFRDELEATGVVLSDPARYRLATVLARVDHAAAEIVLQQARRLEAEGQLAAFDESLERPLVTSATEAEIRSAIEASR